MHRLLFFLLAATSLSFGQSNQPPVFCRAATDGGTRLEQRIGSYRLTLSPTKDQDAPCTARLFGRGQKLLWTRSLWQAQFATPPLDITNDGKPDFIVEDYSGGAHCCWTYLIISPDSGPIRPFLLENQMKLAFKSKWHGKNTIVAGDGAFDYFVTSHAFSFFPDVYLVFSNGKLYDISDEPEFRGKYDATIAEATRELARLDPQKKWLQQEIGEIDEEIRFNVMEIVLSYLYSRRPKEAWHSLNELWPKKEQDETKANILKTRRAGILKRALPLPQK